MRRWYFGLTAVLSLTLFASVGSYLFSSDGKTGAGANNQPPAPVNARNRIDRVTVYLNRALVTRAIEVPEGEGLAELVITPMPDQIVPNTMYSEGADGLRVLTTRFTTRQVQVDTSKARRDLESELEKLQIVAAKIDSDILSLQQNMQLLNKLESVAEKGKHSGEEVITLSKYVMEQRADKAKELVGIMEKKRQNNVKMEFAQRRMGELGRGSGRVERDAIVVVDREKGKGGTIRLNYLVGSVAWRPEYKLRAGKADEKVQVDYLASVMQHSGEDWGQVKLTLSTAQPLLEASPPELCMLEPVLVNRGTPGAPPMPVGGGFASPFANAYGRAELGKKAGEQRRLAGQNFGKADFKAQKDAARQLNEAAAWEQNADLMRSRDDVLAAARKGGKVASADPSRTDGPSVTFHLPNKLTVPNRNEEQVIEITKLNLTPKFYYKAVPVLNRHVYRLADLANKSTFELLPGEATMYQGTDFVGRMPMPLVAIGEEFTAGFGVDTQLQIQRQMVDQNRSTLGGNQVLSYNYRILISSYKNDPVKLQLWDRLPKGENNESVTVNLVKHSPTLSEDGIYKRESRPNNLLRWDLDVPANCNGEKALPVTYEFSMQLDRQMAITGFQSR